MQRQHHRSSLFPYTTLFRSLSFVTGSPGGPTIISATLLSILNWMRLGMEPQAAINAPRFHRSEEHTSELQSLRHLVCRLLLEKKKTLRYTSTLITSAHCTVY